MASVTLLYFGGSWLFDLGTHRNSGDLATVRAWHSPGHQKAMTADIRPVSFPSQKRPATSPDAVDLWITVPPLDRGGAPLSPRKRSGTGQLVDKRVANFTFPETLCSAMAHEGSKRFCSRETPKVQHSTSQFCTALVYGRRLPPQIGISDANLPLSEWPFDWYMRPSHVVMLHRRLGGCVPHGFGSGHLLAVI